MSTKWFGFGYNFDNYYQMSCWQLLRDSFLYANFKNFKSKRFHTQPSLTFGVSTHRWMSNHEWRMTTDDFVRRSPSIIYIGKKKKWFKQNSNSIQPFAIVRLCVFNLIWNSIFNRKFYFNSNDLFMWCMQWWWSSNFFIMQIFLFLPVCLLFIVSKRLKIILLEFFFSFYCCCCFEPVIYLCKHTHRIGDKWNFRDKQSKSQSHQFCGIK